MDRETVRRLTGLGSDVAGIAYLYLCKGVGQHQTEAGHVGRLPEGAVEVVVREFVPLGDREPEAGYIDVIFIGEDGVELCYFEFRVEVTGRGGVTAGRLVSK